MFGKQILEIFNRDAAHTDSNCVTRKTGGPSPKLKKCFTYH